MGRGPAPDVVVTAGDGTAGPPPSRRERWDARHAARDPIESHHPDPTLVEVARGLEPGRALDLGTGDGRNALWLAANGWLVTGVDFSRVALERARATARARGLDVAWRNEDLLDWQPDPGTFDLVTLLFIHLPPEERAAVYGSAAAAVAPGGRLLVVGHDRDNLEHGVGGPQDPALLLTPDRVVADLPAGFAVERAETIRRDEDGVAQLDTVVVARRER
jgi:SAM-dependent methyltransferase